jgi:hypothetical protein
LLWSWWLYAGNLLTTFVVTAFVAVIASEYLLSTRASAKLFGLFEPILRAARISSHFSAPMLLGAFDERSAHLSVSSMVKSGRARENEVVVFGLLLKPIAHPRLLVQFLLPVALPALGLGLGVLYSSLSLASTLVAPLLGIALSRMTIKASPRQSGDVIHGADLIDHRGSPLKAAVERALKCVKFMGARYLATLTAMFILMKIGLFDLLRQISANPPLPVKPELLATIAASIPLEIGSLQLAGDMLREGLLTSKEVLTALFIGRALHVTISACPRVHFPLYASLYSARLALKLVVAQVLYTIASSAVAISISLLF